jgi:hypothetical protein
MIRTQGGAEGRIYSGRLTGAIQVPPFDVSHGGGSAGEACLTRALGRETPVELDLLQVEKVH